MEEAARPAQASDVAELVVLARAGQQALVEARGGDVYLRCEGRRDDLEADLLGALDDPDRFVLAGTLDEVVVGYAAGRVVTLADGGKLGRVDDLYVVPEAREVGVGELLIGAVLDHCRAAGCTGVDAHALPGERLTKNFFETAHFTARLLVVHHRLVPKPVAS